MCLTENDTLLFWGLDLTLQPEIPFIFRYKLAGLKFTIHRISSSELLFTSQREPLNHIGMFEKKSSCGVECVYLALLSLVCQMKKAFTCFMWWFSCWERKCSDTDCLSTACLWLQGNLSLHMLSTRNPIPLNPFLYVLIWGHLSIKGSILVLSDQRILLPLAAFVALEGTLSGFSAIRLRLAAGMVNTVELCLHCIARVTIGFTVTSFIKTLRVLLTTKESWFFGLDSREPWAWQRCFFISCETFYRLLCPHNPLNSTQMDSNHFIDMLREDGRCSELCFRCRKGLKTSFCWRFYSFSKNVFKKKPCKIQISFVIFRPISDYFRTRP